MLVKCVVDVLVYISRIISCIMGWHACTEGTAWLVAWLVACLVACLVASCVVQLYMPFEQAKCTVQLPTPAQSTLHSDSVHDAHHVFACARTKQTQVIRQHIAHLARTPPS
jgi:hypothetical protein